MNYELRLLSGWGQTSPTSARVARPATADQAAALLASAPSRGVIARGLGRCYGDAAQNAGGTVICTTGLNRIIHIDGDRATAWVEAGVSLDQLMRAALPLGLWPVVTPGTRQVTVGGAIASDVHGKNHHRDGTFVADVSSFVIATPACGVFTASPTEKPEVFWATAGGMGLTGLVLEATLQLSPVETSYMAVTTERHPNLDSLMARMTEGDDAYRYSVAWVDCLARGRSLGRSVLEWADHARREDLPAELRGRNRILAFNPHPRITAPSWLPSITLNRLSMTAFNQARFRLSPRHSEKHVVPMAAFFHPLDFVSDWNRAYGPSGFLQYQIVVPDPAASLVRQTIELLSRHRCGGFLGVLKRLGAANPGPLSFPRPGWTLALDLPARPGRGVGPLLDRLDEAVAEAGGRVYLSKDSRLRPELLCRMYPDLPRWKAIRHRLDPEGRLCSDLARRVWSLRCDQPARP